MKRKSFLAVYALTAGTFVSTAAGAIDAVIVGEEARNEVAAELAECAAYYAITSAMLEASLAPGAERDDAVAGAKRSGEAAILAAAKLSSNDVATARMNLAAQTMQRQLKGDYRNFSLIAVDHMWQCKDRVEAPDKRFQYWLEEKKKLQQR